jgi:quinol monooxygenase YgiN
LIPAIELAKFTQPNQLSTENMEKRLTIIFILTMVFIVSSFAQTKSSGMESKNYSTEIIRYNIPEQERGNFEKAYTQAGQYLQASEYCLGYQVIHGSEEPNHYIVIIYWTSEQDHLTGFRKGKDFMPFFNLVKPFYNNLEEMKHYRLTDNQWMRKQ